MLKRTVFFFVLLSAFVLAAQTQYGARPTSPSGSRAHSQDPAITACPWLTQGTAATALGGDVLATVNMSDTLEGSCRFSKGPGSSDYLEIHVSKAVLPSCPEESAMLKGIGNQATRCSRPGSQGQSVDMISSRVRDLYFTVTLVSPRQKNAAKAVDVQNDPLEQVAEQVAGTLY